MKEPLPFDHRPDLVLGKALREALDPGDPAGFVARWARAGVAAAVVVALAAGYLVGRATAAPLPPSGRPTVTDVLMTPPAHPAEVEVVLASVIGN